MDQVHFEGLYQVHHPCPRSHSGPHWVYQVHPLKSDQVHLARKHPPVRGAALLLRPWQTAFLPARGTAPPFCPWQLLSISVDSPAVDQVHFDALYQVHHPCPKTFSEPHSVYQVHPMKSDLVHLTTKTITTRGAETLLRPGQPVFFAARGAEAPLRPRQLPFPPSGALELFSSLPLWQEDSSKQTFYILLTGILFWKQAVCRVLSQEDSTQTMLQGLFSGILDQL